MDPMNGSSMRHAVTAALVLQLAATVLAGCSNGADKPARALLDALSGLGLRNATYESAALTADGFRVSRVQGTDDDGRPVTAEEILAERPAGSGDGWRAANVIVNGLDARRLSARSLVLADVSRNGSGPTVVGSYRATGIRSTLHGAPVTAREISGSPREDGGEIAFSDLAFAGDTWNGRLRVAGGPGTASISMNDLRSSRGRLDLSVVAGGITPKEAMAYMVAAEPVPLPPALLLQAGIEGTVPVPAGTITAPDPSGFQDPPVRALAEALPGMVSAGMLDVGLRFVPRGGVPLKDLEAIARAPDAYRRLGIILLTERMPQGIARRVLPLTTGQAPIEARPPGGPAPR
jgi:hypothetical protein